MCISSTLFACVRRINTNVNIYNDFLKNHKIIKSIHFFKILCNFLYPKILLMSKELTVKEQEKFLKRGIIPSNLQF
jgi:hypothetical protein